MSHDIPECRKELRDALVQTVQPVGTLTPADWPRLGDILCARIGGHRGFVIGALRAAADQLEHRR